MRVQLSNFEGGPGVPLLTLGGSRAPLLNFKVGPGSQVPGSRDPGSCGPGLTFTPCQNLKSKLFNLRLLASLCNSNYLQIFVKVKLQ